MDVTILGSGTLLPDDAHRSASHLIEGESFRMLLDCGSGAVHGMARDGVAWHELSHVAISHFHTDHTGDLAPLLWALKHGAAGREENLVILGPPGVRGLVEALSAAHGDFVLDPGFPVEIVEVEAGGRWLDGDAGIEVLTHETVHTPESIAWRIEAEGFAVGYTGDTGPHPLLGAFFSGVDLLITECAMSDENAMDNHLSPRTVAALLRDARPGHAVLTHLYPEVDREGLPDLLEELGFTGRASVAWDGMRTTLVHP